MSFFQALDHPADILITFEAENLKEVYRLAAVVLFELIYNEQKNKTPVKVVSREFIKVVDKEELLSVLQPDVIAS